MNQILKAHAHRVTAQKGAAKADTQDDDTYVDDSPDDEAKPIRLDRFVSDDWSDVESLTPTPSADKK